MREAAGMENGVISEGFSPAREDAQAQHLRDRILEVYAASRTGEAGSTGPSRDAEARMLVEKAKLFFGFPIPNWPPQMFVRRVVRRLLFPIFWPQVVFNEAARDLILDARYRNEEQSRRLREASEAIAALEEEVSLLRQQVQALSRRAASFGATAPAVARPAQSSDPT